MAIGDPYVTLPEIKNYLDIPSNKLGYDDRLTDALDSASREIEQYCGRQFNQSTTATARVYEPDGFNRVTVDDFYTTTGLVVAGDYSYDGTFGTIYDPLSYELFPLGGVVDGSPGWPYTKIRMSYSAFPFVGSRYSRRTGVVQVTAKWGWAAVPTTVAQACKLIAAQNFKMADAPLGVAGMDVVRGTQFTGAFGTARVQDLPAVAHKLDRFKSMRILVG